MKCFVECIKCGFIVTSAEIHAKKMLGLVTKGIYTCHNCKEPLDFTTVHFCFKKQSPDCDGCRIKFTCFSSVTTY